MHLHPNQTRSIRPTIKDEFDGGFQKPTTATEIRLFAEPADLVTVNGESITWAKPGSGTLRAEALYPDGSLKQVEGTIPITCLEPVAPPPAPQPAFTRAVIVDIE